MERTVRDRGSKRRQVADSLRKSVTNPHGDCYSYCYCDSHCDCNGDSYSHANSNGDGAAEA